MLLFHFRSCDLYAAIRAAIFVKKQIFEAAIRAAIKASFFANQPFLKLQFSVITAFFILNFQLHHLMLFVFLFWTHAVLDFAMFAVERVWCAPCTAAVSIHSSCYCPGF
ncbi:unnamed protein product [Amaranthus hypochondriacus]